MKDSLAKVWTTLKAGFRKLSALVRTHQKMTAYVTVGVVLVVIGLYVCGTFFQSQGISSKAVEQRMQDIGELATQEAYVTIVNKDASKAKLFGIDVPLTDSKYIFSYDVTIKAGLNFADVSLTVDEQHKIVTVTLPEVTILETSLDLDSLEVYDESNNIFNPLKISQMNTNQQLMEDQGKEKALNMGILAAAQSNAEVLMTNLLVTSYPTPEWIIRFN